MPHCFFDSAVSFNLECGKINTASPENIILLKLWRACCEKRFFGKDKVDIANLFLAHYFKENSKEINKDKISGGIYDNLTKNFDEARSFCKCLKEARPHLKKDERDLLVYEIFSFENSLEKVYAEKQ